MDADVELPARLAKLLKTKVGVNYKETVIPPGVATRNVRGSILFKCCCVNNNKETKRLEIPRGEYIGKGNRSWGVEDCKSGTRWPLGVEDDEESAIGDEALMDLDTDETDLPGNSRRYTSYSVVLQLILVNI